MTVAIFAMSYPEIDDERLVGNMNGRLPSFECWCSTQKLLHYFRAKVDG